MDWVFHGSRRVDALGRRGGLANCLGLQSFHFVIRELSYQAGHDVLVPE